MYNQVDERVIRVLESAIHVIKEPKSQQDLYEALRLLGSIATHEANKIKS